MGRRSAFAWTPRMRSFFGCHLSVTFRSRTIVNLAFIYLILISRTSSTRDAIMTLFGGAEWRDVGYRIGFASLLVQSRSLYICIYWSASCKVFYTTTVNIWEWLEFRYCVRFDKVRPRSLSFVLFRRPATGVVDAGRRLATRAPVSATVFVSGASLVILWIVKLSDPRATRPL